MTHALVSSLYEDRNLLKRFIHWVVEDDTPSANRLKIVEQQLPGEPEEIEEGSESRGLPDAWVHDDNEWSLLIESKIESPLTRDQLNRHLRTATRRGFSNTRLLALVVKKPVWSPPPMVRVIEWTILYSWLRGEKQSECKYGSSRLKIAVPTESLASRTKRCN